MVRELMCKDNDLDDTDANSDKKALHTAVYRLDLQQVEIELRQGADPNALMDEGGTPLHYLAHALAEEEENADNTGDDEVWFEAEANGKLIATLLLAAGANPELRHKDLRPCDTFASGFFRSTRQFMFLIGADPNARNRNGYSLLHRGCDDVVYAEMLVAAGADVNARDNLGRTPIHNCSYPESVDFLVKYGADLEAQDIYGETLLCIALQDNNFELVEHLLTIGANVNVLDSRGSNLLDLHASSTSESSESLRLLLIERSEQLRGLVNQLDVAIAHGDIDAVRTAVAAGIDLNELNAQKKLPLCHAVRRVWMDDSQAMSEVDDRTQREMNLAVAFVGELLNLGANPNPPDFFRGETPLGAVLSRRNPWRSQWGRSPQLDAVQQVVELLLLAGADPNIQSEFDLPLKSACSSGWEEIAKTLVAGGASVQMVLAQDANGNLQGINRTRGNKWIVDLLRRPPKK